MKFCKQCGKPLEDGKAFCTSCGHQSEQVQQETSSQRVKDPVSKKKLIWGLTAAVLVIAGVAAHLFLSNLHTTEKAVASLKQAIESEDAEQLAELMNQGQEHIDVTKEEAKGYLEYLKENADIDEILAGLKKERRVVEKGKKGEVYKDDYGNEVLALEKKKNFLFLYKRYGITFFPVEILAFSKFEGAAIKVDGKDPVQLEEADTTKRVAFLFPGEHKLKAEIKNDYADFENEMELDFTEAEANKLRVDAGIEGEWITVYSNDDQAILFVNGNSTGKKVADIDYFGPLELDGSVKLHAERTVDGKVEKSSSVNVEDEAVSFWFGDERVADEYEEVNIQVEPEETFDEWLTEETDFTEYMGSYYDAVVASVNNGSFTLASDYFDFDSPLYEQQGSYTNRLAEAGTQEELLAFDVQSVEETSDGYKVTVKEEWNFYKQIEESSHEVLTADYYIRWVFGDLKIYDIQNINKLLEEPI